MAKAIMCIEEGQADECTYVFGSRQTSIGCRWYDWFCEHIGNYVEDEDLERENWELYDEIPTEVIDKMAYDFVVDIKGCFDFEYVVKEIILDTIKIL